VSRRPWIIDNDSGLSHRKLAHVDWIDLNDVGGSLRRRWPDTNIYNVGSMAAIVGRSQAYFRDSMLSDARSLFHLHRENVVDDRGRVVATLFATHVNSLTCAMDAWRGVSAKR